MNMVIEYKHLKFFLPQFYFHFEIQKESAFTLPSPHQPTQITFKYYSAHNILLNGFAYL